MRQNDQYVVLEWLHDLPGFPRYGFATIKHAEELGPNVQWLQMCPSLETAAAIASTFNFPDASLKSDRLSCNSWAAIERQCRGPTLLIREDTYH